MAINHWDCVLKSNLHTFVIGMFWMCHEEKQLYAAFSGFMTTRGGNVWLLHLWQVVRSFPAMCTLSMAQRGDGGSVSICGFPFFYPRLHLHVEMNWKGKPFSHFQLHAVRFFPPFSQHTENKGSAGEPQKTPTLDSPGRGEIQNHVMQSADVCWQTSVMCLYERLPVCFHLCGGEFQSWLSMLLL